MLTAVIVDDDAPQRALLRYVLGKSCADIVQVIGEADSLKSAVRNIAALQPKLVFLDVELTGHDTGFDVLEEYEDPNFGVIFVTAYSDFAAQAYNYDPINFLVKPVNEVRLRKAVERAWRVLGTDSFQEYNVFADTKELQYKGASGTIILQDGRDTLTLDAKDIILCKGQGNYTEIILERVYTLRKPLKELEDIFAQRGFLRIHRSTIVNPAYIQKVNAHTRDLSLTLKNGLSVAISQPYKLLLFETLGIKSKD